MATATMELGPWNRGLNLTRNRDLSAYLDSNELGEAINITFSRDGFIEPRPGCKVLLQAGALGAPDELYTGNPDFYVLGSVILPTGEAVVLVNAFVGGNSKVFKVYSPERVVYYFTATGTRLTHVQSYEISDPDHRGVFFFSIDDNKSYRTTDFSLVTAPTLIPGTFPIPGSDGGIIVKNRLFLWNYKQSAFMWSTPLKVLKFNFAVQTDPAIDEGGREFIDKTTEADGIMSVEFLRNSFYIFKRSKTYMFTYQDNPNEDAYLKKISNEFGALDSSSYRNNLVVINNRGVFRVDNDQFTDLQPQLNLRFEIPLDHTNILTDNIFITDFNNDIVVGYRDTSTNKKYYYCMNGQNGAWSEWSFDYLEGDDAAVPLAAPGSRQYRCQDANTTYQAMIFSTFDRKRVVYMDWKPKDLRGTVVGYEGPGNYHLDSQTDNVRAHDYNFIPSISIKTRASIGGSILKYKKVHRSYLRMYLSEQASAVEPADPPAVVGVGQWTLSINFNDYRFRKDAEHDPEQSVALKYPTGVGRLLGTYVSTDVRNKVYQIPLQQIRAREFVFDIKRSYSKINFMLSNPDADRLIKQGYYFMLSGLWFDFEDKAGI